jgi:UDP-N-acetylmuramoyl-tripeptide--D-alanyl-D-alanine ligase
MKLVDIQRMFGSVALSPEMSEMEPRGYSIDSRTIAPGELFFAIKGEIHDGHRFVRDVLSRGAVAAVVNKGFPAAEAHSTVGAARLIEVDDTLSALQQLASAILRGWRGKLTAITGSMGKTTTKEMTASALGAVGRVIKTAGNLNNEFGLPLSVLKMESSGTHADDYDYAVLEMGMNHKGEIAHLCRIAAPDVSVVTVVAPVHLAFFSSVDEIAEAKSEIVLGTKQGGLAVINADDDRVARMAGLRSDVDFRTFGIERSADVMAREVKTIGLDRTEFRLLTPRGEAQCSLPAAGRHNVYNALAASAVADHFGVGPADIAATLARSSSPKMRGELIRFSAGFTVIDDSYNSNPRALAEMVRTVASTPVANRRIVVAGEMLELGEAGAELHREVGAVIAGTGIDRLVAVRGLARELVAGALAGGLLEDAATFCDSPEEAAELVINEVRPGDLVLVKGSRGVRTEIVVQRLKQAFEHTGERGGPG